MSRCLRLWSMSRARHALRVRALRPACRRRTRRRPAFVSAPEKGSVLAVLAGGGGVSEGRSRSARLRMSRMIRSSQALDTPARKRGSPRQGEPAGAAVAGGYERADRGRPGTYVICRDLRPAPTVGTGGSTRPGRRCGAGSPAGNPRPADQPGQTVRRLVICCCQDCQKVSRAGLYADAGTA